MFSGYQSIGQGSSLGATAPMPGSGMSSMGATPSFQPSSLGASEPRPQPYQQRYPHYQSSSTMFQPTHTIVVTRPRQEPVTEYDCRCPCVIL